MKLKKALAATTIFIFILTIIYTLHATFFEVDVLLYASVMDLLLATTLTGLFLFSFKYFITLNNFEKSQLLLIWLFLGYSLVLTIPTVIDRSLSFYILEKLQQRGGGIKQNRMEEVFTREYVREHRLLDVRLTEQLESGTIIIEDGCVKLTKRGVMVATFGRFFRQHLLPKKRLFLGVYSDDLTDPFRKSLEPLNYSCK